MSGIGLILLAAGGSSRMGQPKQLLPYGGKPLIRHAVETALASICRPIIVVLGARSEIIKPSLVGLPVQLVKNMDWEQGVGTSIRAGLQAIEVYDPNGVILALADQPLVTPQILDRLITGALASGSDIVASEYSGTVGVPAFFRRTVFESLAALPPDKGCKGVILGHPGPVLRLACPEAEADVDSPEDWLRLQPR